MATKSFPILIFILLSFAYLSWAAEFRLKRDTRTASPTPVYAVNRLPTNIAPTPNGITWREMLKRIAHLYRKFTAEADTASLLPEAPELPAEGSHLRLQKPLQPSVSMQGNQLYQGERNLFPANRWWDPQVGVSSENIQPRDSVFYRGLPSQKSRLARDVSRLNQESSDSSEQNTGDGSESSSEESAEDNTSGSLDRRNIGTSSGIRRYGVEPNPFEFMRNLENKDFSTKLGGMDKGAGDSSSGIPGVHGADAFQVHPGSYQHLFIGTSPEGTGAEPPISASAEENDDSGEKVLSSGLSDRNPSLLNGGFLANDNAFDQTATGDRPETLELQIYRRLNLDDGTSNGEQAKGTAFSDETQGIVNALGGQSALRDAYQRGPDGGQGNTLNDGWTEADVLDWKLQSSGESSNKNIDLWGNSAERFTSMNEKEASGFIPIGPLGNNYVQGGQYLTDINMLTGLDLNPFNEEKSQEILGAVDKTMESLQSAKNSVIVNIPLEDFGTVNKKPATWDSNLRERSSLGEMPYLKIFRPNLAVNGNSNVERLGGYPGFSDGKNLEARVEPTLVVPNIYNQRISEFRKLNNGRSTGFSGSKTLDKTAKKKGLGRYSAFSDGKKLNVIVKPTLVVPTLYNQRISEFRKLNNGRSTAFSGSKTLDKTAKKEGLGGYSALSNGKSLNARLRPTLVVPTIDRNIRDNQQRDAVMRHITILNNMQGTRSARGGIGQRVRDAAAAKDMQVKPNLNKFFTKRPSALNAYLAPFVGRNPGRHILLPRLLLSASQNEFTRGDANLNYAQRAFLKRGTNMLGSPTAAKHSGSRDLHGLLRRKQASSKSLDCMQTNSEGGFKLKNGRNSDND